MPSFLPISTQQRRPRTVCELRSGSVVAARADDVNSLLTHAAFVEIREGAFVPSLRGGNMMERAAVVDAVRAALSKVADRSRDVTLVIPDAAVRVLLLDFDTFPAKLADAMPILRFRLTKLLPFSADQAMISYQVMSSRQGIVQVLAVATPREVLNEYESVVRDAGYEPGSVLPSTLATVGALHASEPVLLVNADENTVTTAIVKRGDVLLHRSVDLAPHVVAVQPVGDEIVAVAAPVNVMEEIHQAVAVALSYYEDVVGAAPRDVYISGARAQDEVRPIIAELEMNACDVIASGEVLPSAAGARVPRSMMAGVRGATAA